MKFFLNLALVIAGAILVIFFTHERILWFDGWALGALLVGIAVFNVIEKRTSSQEDEGWFTRFLKDALGVKDKK